jgi:hypothetical protein
MKIVFIIGCGRSGTTILGRALSCHPKVTYLNEPREIWFSCFPQTDIWTEKAVARGGRLVLTEIDAEATSADKLRKEVFDEVSKTGKPILIEKLPINGFRLSFLRKIFPKSRFIHLFRNGLEVASSIDKLAKKKWYGVNDYKWKQLVAYAESCELTRQLPKLCVTDYERGLLEWRLINESIRDFTKLLPPDDFHEVKYDELISNPIGVLRRLITFIGIEQSKEVEDFVHLNISRKSEIKTTKVLTDKEELIAGILLRAYGKTFDKCLRRR